MGILGEGFHLNKKMQFNRIIHYRIHRMEKGYGELKLSWEKKGA